MVYSKARAKRGNKVFCKYIYGTVRAVSIVPNSFVRTAKNPENYQVIK